MATFNKFDQFVEDIANGVHDLGSHQLVIALSNTAPDAADAVLADITEIAYTNLSSRNVTTTSATQTAGILRAILADLVLTASGDVATWRYAILYNDTPAGDPLIGWIDRGSALSMVNEDTETIDFDQTLGAFSLA